MEGEEEFQELAREDVKKAIKQPTKREKHNSLDEWTDKCIRVNHKTYMLVEVNKDRNGRMIYTPLKATPKPEISFVAKIRTPNESDNEEKDIRSIINEITKVEYPQTTREKADFQNPNIKIKVDVEVINKKGHNRSSKR